MRQHRRKFIYILFPVLVIILIILVICSLSLKESDKGNISNKEVALNEAIDLGSGLKLTKLSEAAGNFPEDGSDEFVEKVLSATFANEGKKAIQYASVYVTVGEEKFSFAFSTIPAGESVCVYEANKKSLSGGSGEVTAETEYIAYFQDEPSVRAEELEITVSDGIISVKNISGADIDKEISVFYKNVSGAVYIGGITYRFRIPQGLKAGEEYQGNAMHVLEKMTKVMFVTYGN